MINPIFWAVILWPFATDKPGLQGHSRQTWFLKFSSHVGLAGFKTLHTDLRLLTVLGVSYHPLNSRTISRWPCSLRYCHGVYSPDGVWRDYNHQHRVLLEQCWGTGRIKTSLFSMRGFLWRESFQLPLLAPWRRYPTGTENTCVYHLTAYFRSVFHSTAPGVPHRRCFYTNGISGIK